MLKIELNKSKLTKCRQCGENIRDEWRVRCTHHYCGDTFYHVDCVRELVK